MKLRAKIVVGLAVAHVFLTSGPVRAEPSASEFLQWVDQGGEAEQIASLTLHSYHNGLSWANTELRSQNRTPLFCAPDRVALTADQIVDILRRFVREEPRLASSPAGLILLMALTDAFPC